MVREAPTAFVAEMRRRFSDFRDVRWNDAINRWEFIFVSAAMKEVSQFLGWTKNPLTGETIEPDPITGLRPFRDLDAEAQAFVIKSCEETFIGRRGDGSSSWREHIVKGMRHNRAVHTTRRKKEADDFAYAIQQVDLRRPWVKDHQRSTSKLIVPVGIIGGSKRRRAEAAA